MAGKMPKRSLGNTGVELPVLGFGGVIICADEFEDAARCREFVQSAVARGATYIDVAPEYGDGVSQARLGPALEGVRDQCFLACKTMFRDAAGAATDLAISLAALRTDHLDLYQMHSVTTKEDVDQILAPGGCLELFKQKKAEGVIKHIGFSAHDEEQVRARAAPGRGPRVAVG
jgi:predicted aldo/keto reductase-like oxidoreductase